jgi:quercetin 2,3-dioxygenase
MAQDTQQQTGRGVTRVTERQVLGADAQVDRKAVVVPPGDWGAHDPFLLLFEDWFSAVGFDWHPHRGIETVTVVLDGQLEHRDNRGGHGVLGEGDVQWMTACNGLVHTELARGQVHSLQLWVNLPADAKLVEPRYQDLRAADMPVRTEPGVTVRVFSGRSGDVEGPAANHHPVTMVDARLDPGATLVQELDPTARGFAYVLDGDGRFGSDGVAAATGQVVWLDPGAPDAPAEWHVTAGDDGVRFLFWAGEPLAEPVVTYGPFVMNTRAQIADALADYQAGRFGPVPA